MRTLMSALGGKLGGTRRAVRTGFGSAAVGTAVARMVLEVTTIATLRVTMTATLRGIFMMRRIFL